MFAIKNALSRNGLVVQEELSVFAVAIQTGCQSGLSLRQQGGSVSFCGFPWVETSTAGRVYDLCVYYIDGSTRRLTESGFMRFYGFMEKPGIEPATPGLQGIALIHYTTGASQVGLYPMIHN